MDKSKGKSSERMQQPVDELEYFVTFNQSISQAMARTMQDLLEGVLNTFLNTESFKMETPETIRTSYRQGSGLPP